MSHDGFRRHRPKTRTLWLVSNILASIIASSARPAVGRTGQPAGSRGWVSQQHSLETCHSALKGGTQVSISGRWGSLSASRALRPGGAATAPFRPGTTTTILGSRRPEQSIIAIYCAERVKSRPGTDLPDTYGRCLSRLLSAGPRPRASRAASRASSAEAGPRWGGAETKHGVQIEQSFGGSFLGDAWRRVWP